MPKKSQWQFLATGKLAFSGLYLAVQPVSIIFEK